MNINRRSFIGGLVAMMSGIAIGSKAFASGGFVSNRTYVVRPGNDEFRLSPERARELAAFNDELMRDCQQNVNLAFQGDLDITLEVRTFCKRDIAAIFQVPPRLIGCTCPCGCDL